jgi:hypothetical protein
MMIVSLLLMLQAGTAADDGDVREKYEPYRKCLVEQGRPLAGSGRTDEEIIDEARGKCLASNLGSGSAALFALMKKGATKEQAIGRGARLREEVEREAAAALRASPGAPGVGSAVPSTGTYRMRRLAIPDEIAPAVRPYMQCLGRADPRKPPRSGNGSLCRAERARAASDSDRMLRRAGRGKPYRRALIEKTLAEIDAFHRPFAPGSDVRD